ncbi:hypothetical protein AB2B38_003535 [Balneola sp. MJW-20]|uniref:hypothetical protein n=1 Tax=Gracilimonas aurantiaca TaxID=3234185 RepID=UPI00346788ED
MSIQYINKQDHLEDLLPKLHQNNRIGVDLEFDRNRYRYGFNLCLIQIYDGEKAYLVDPLSDEVDLSGLFSLFEDQDQELVVYSFGEDLRLLHSLNCFPTKIADLDHALRLLNYPPGSLGKHLEQTTGVELPPSSQQSNWFKRPLTEKQQVYAAADVLYLLDLYDHLIDELKREDIKHWFEQENHWLESQDYSNEDHSVLFRDKDKKGMNAFEWYIYQQLMYKIDETAEKLNRPIYHIAPKYLIARVAKDPSLLDSWSDQKKIFPGVRNQKFGKELKSVYNRAHQEAMEQGISKSDPAESRWTREEHQEHKRKKQQINKVKNATLGPVQNAIVSDIGQHAQTFILPNGLVEDIILNKADLPDYKAELIRTYSNRLDLDLSELEILKNI